MARGLGALGGDALKSFIKPRLGIAPGMPWIPADQLDFVVVGIVAVSFFVRMTPPDIAWILAISLLGDIGVNHLSFRLGIRDKKW